MKRTGTCSYKMFLTSLRETMQRYFDAKNITTLDDLAEAMLHEQFLAFLPDNVRAFVISKKAANATEASDFADLFLKFPR